MKSSLLASNLSPAPGRRAMTGAAALAAAMAVLAGPGGTAAHAARRFAQAADLGITLACPSQLGAGTTGKCTLQATDHGPGTATGLRTVVTLSSQLAEVSCTGGCQRTGPQQYQWTAATLSPGRSITYTVTVRGTRTGTGPVRAQATSASHDPKPGNNTASRQVTVYTLQARARAGHQSQAVS